MVKPKTNSHQLVTNSKKISHQKEGKTEKNTQNTGGDEYLEQLHSNDYRDNSHQLSSVGGGVCVQDAMMTNSDPRQLSHTEPDYSTYPHLTSDTLEAKRNQAEQIKQRLLESDSRDELAAVRAEFSTRCDWVWQNLLTKTEKVRLKAIASTEQLNLFDQDHKSEEVQFKAGDCPRGSGKANRVTIAAGGRFDGKIATVIGPYSDPHDSYIEVKLDQEDGGYTLQFRPDCLRTILTV